MSRKYELTGAVAIAMLAAAPAYADTIKIGVIGTMSGPYALFGQRSA